MSDDETRPEDTGPAPGASDDQADESVASTPPDTAEVPEAPALDAGDEDPDALAGDFTDPDVDLDSLLEVEPDKDGE